MNQKQDTKNAKHKGERDSVLSASVFNRI